MALRAIFVDQASVGRFDPHDASMADRFDDRSQASCAQRARRVLDRVALRGRDARLEADQYRPREVGALSGESC